MGSSHKIVQIFYSGKIPGITRLGGDGDCGKVRRTWRGRVVTQEGFDLLRIKEFK